MMAMGIGSLAGQSQAPAQRLFATLQKPGVPSGYLSSSLKTGIESTAGFFAVTGKVMRLGNTDYKIIENAAKSKDGKTFSLKDKTGHFLICCKSDAASVGAAPTNNAQLFLIRFFTAAQKAEIEDRQKANQNVHSQPGFGGPPN
jgi:hypothetical protein